MNDNSIIFAGEFDLTTIDLTDLDLTTADRRAAQSADRAILLRHGNTHGIGMVIIFFVTFFKFEVHALLLGNLEGIADAIVIRFKAEHTAHKRTVCTMTAISLGKGAKELEMNVHDLTFGHQPCHVGDLQGARRVGAGRSDHDRANDIKYADLSHRHSFPRHFAAFRHHPFLFDKRAEETALC